MKKCLKGNSDIKKRMSLIKGCKAELRKKNIKFIDGVPLHMCKHKVISNKYCEIFNRNPLDDYRKSDYNRKILRQEYASAAWKSINSLSAAQPQSYRKRCSSYGMGSFFYGPDFLSLHNVPRPRLHDNDRRQESFRRRIGAGIPLR